MHKLFTTAFLFEEVPVVDHAVLHVGLHVHVLLGVVERHRVDVVLLLALQLTWVNENLSCLKGWGRKKVILELSFKMNPGISFSPKRHCLDRTSYLIKAYSNKKKIVRHKNRSRLAL